MSSTFDYAAFDDEVGWADIDGDDVVEVEDKRQPIYQSLRKKASSFFQRPAIIIASSPEPGSEFEIISPPKSSTRKRIFNLTPGKRKTNKARFQYTRTPTPRRYTPSPTPRAYTTSPIPFRSYSNNARQSTPSIDIAPSWQVQAAAGPSRHQGRMEELSSSVEAISLGAEGGSVEMEVMDVQEEESEVGQGDEEEESKTTEEIIIASLHYFNIHFETMFINAIISQTHLPLFSIMNYLYHIRTYRPDPQDEVETRRMTDLRLEAHRSLLEPLGLWKGAAMPTGTFTAPVCLEQAWATSHRTLELVNIMLVMELYTPRTLLEHGFRPIDPRVYAFDIVEPRQGSNINHLHLPRWRHELAALVSQFYPDATKKAQERIQQSFDHSIAHFRDLRSDTSNRRFILSQGEFNKLAASKITVSEPAAYQTITIPISIPAIPAVNLPSTVKEVSITLLVVNHDIMHVIIPLRHASAPKYTMKSGESFKHGFVADIFYNYALQLLERPITDTQMSVYSRESMPSMNLGEIDGGRPAMQRWMAQMGDKLADVTAETLPTRFKNTFADLNIPLDEIRPTKIAPTFASAAYGKLMQYTRLNSTTAEQRSLAAIKGQETRQADPEAFRLVRDKLSRAQSKPDLQQQRRAEGKSAEGLKKLAKARAAKADLIQQGQSFPPPPVSAGQSQRGKQRIKFELYDDGHATTYILNEHMDQGIPIGIMDDGNGQAVDQEMFTRIQKYYTGGTKEAPKSMPRNMTRVIEPWRCGHHPVYYLSWTYRLTNNRVTLYKSSGRTLRCPVCELDYTRKTRQPCGPALGCVELLLVKNKLDSGMSRVHGGFPDLSTTPEYQQVITTIAGPRPQGQGNKVFSAGIVRAKKSETAKDRYNLGRRVKKAAKRALLVLKGEDSDSD